LRDGVINHKELLLINSGRSSGAIHYVQIRGDNCAS